MHQTKCRNCCGVIKSGRKRFIQGCNGYGLTSSISSSVIHVIFGEESYIMNTYLYSNNIDTNLLISELWISWLV
jgi:hypothetical protein